MTRRLLLLITFAAIASGCKEVAKKSVELPVYDQVQIRKNSVPEEAKEPIQKLKSLVGIADSTFVRLADYDDGFAYELRYATKNNFLKEKVYECAECYIRAKAASALIKANQDFKKEGLRIRFFDCYRPNFVQHKMWKIFPDPKYVANPLKGSIHNKGGAVDITLETLEGKKLDMGTDFDFFGKRSHHNNSDLPQQVLENRKRLKATMEKHDFRSMRTEWWHYHLRGARKEPTANFDWTCE